MEATKRCPLCAEEILEAAQKCKHCGSALSVGVSLPDPSPSTREAAKSGATSAGAGCIAIIVVGGIACAMAFVGQYISGDTHGSVEPQSPPVAQQITEAPPLSGKDAAEALSDFIAALQAKLFVTSMVGTTWGSRIQQDVRFSNLEAYRKDAAELKQSMISTSGEIDAIPVPDNISDADSQYFEAVRQAASDIVSQAVDLAVDIAVQADTGMDASDEFPELARKTKRARKAMSLAAVAGYKHFNVVANRIDPDTLTLKK